MTELEKNVNNNLETEDENLENAIIETVDENGNIIKFELLDIIEFEDKEYGILNPVIDDERAETDNIEDEAAVMRLVKTSEDEYSFEIIEDDQEFQRLVEFIESLEEDEILTEEKE